MKKLLTLLLCLAMLATLCACGSGTDTTESAATTTETASATTAETTAEDSAETTSDGKTYTVGICQLTQHVALDAATQGFIDVLTEELGDSVTIINQNASGDIPTCATIVNGFVSDGVDLILANATPALQAAAAATEDVPILGTAVTEYGVALDLSDFDGTVGGNISGTSDLAPLDQQAAMITELFPEAKTVGILYCSAEANSVYQAEVVKAALEDAGLTVNIYTFADSNDVSSVTASACDESDVIYIPTDNTAASCAEAINNVAEPAGVPIVAGEEGICTGCGVATLSIDYYELGRTTGQMAVRILRDGEDISTMPIEYFPDPVKEYNPAICEALGVTVPDDYVAIAE